MLMDVDDVTVMIKQFCLLLCFLAGSYCEWLKCHPGLLKSVIPVLLDSMTDSTLASAASQALRDICQECSHDLDRESLIAIVNKCQVGDYYLPTLWSSLCTVRLEVPCWQRSSREKKKDLSWHPTLFCRACATLPRQRSL